MQINGACHCGNISFALAWPDSTLNIMERRCGCTFCQKHGGAWTSHQQAELDIDVTNPADTTKYKFGTETADFFVCSRCGVVPFVLSIIDGITYAVVNVHTFEGTDAISWSSAKTNFDGEDTGSRLGRRQQNWIPTVRFRSESANVAGA